LDSNPILFQYENVSFTGFELGLGFIWIHNTGISYAIYDENVSTIENFEEKKITVSILFLGKD